jgi:hypothetical protein
MRHAYVLGDRSCKLSPDGWGRRAVQAYLMEIEPRYVDVEVKRWEDFTGLKAERIAGEQP